MVGKQCTSFAEKIKKAHPDLNVLLNNAAIVLVWPPINRTIVTAIKKLGVNTCESIIFEDSFSGIQAAINCKVANVIIVNSTRENYSEFNFPIIEHFDEFDRDLLDRGFSEAR